MNNAQMSARVGLFFVLGLVLIWVTFESLSDGTVGRKQSYVLLVHFKNLKELKHGDDVRMAGVKIGTVDKTRLDDRRAMAELQIDKRVKVAKDATATIAMAGLLGSNYVSIDLGSEVSGTLDPGMEVRTRDTPDLNSLVGKLGEIGEKVDAALSQFTSAMGGRNGEGLLGKVERLVDENRTKVGEITTNLQSITAKVNDGQGTLGRLVNDPKLHDELVGTVGEIKVAAAQAKDFVANAQAVIDQVKTGQGTLGMLIYDQEAGQNIKVVARNLRELSDKLNQGQGTLGKLFNDDSLYIQAQGALKKVDRALDGLGDQGPITAVGAAANALF